MFGEAAGFTDSSAALAACCNDSRRLGGLTRSSSWYGAGEVKRCVAVSEVTFAFWALFIRAMGGPSLGRAGLGGSEIGGGFSDMRTAAL
jgi:hypothetical protein